MERAFTIKHGTYELACDVDNPQPRKRSREWYHQPSWKAGTKFLIADFHMTDRIVPSVRLLTDRFNAIPMNHPLFWPIVAELQPTEELAPEQPDPEQERADEVDRLMDLIRDSPLLTTERKRSEGIALLESLEDRCAALRDELQTEQLKHGDG